MQLKKACPDCGSAPVNHFFSRVSAIVNHIRLRRHGPTRAFRDLVFYWFIPYVDALALPLTRCAVALRLGNMLNKPDGKTCGRAAFLWEKAAGRGIEMNELRLFGKPVD